MKLDTISTRDAFGNALLQIAEENEHVFAIGADTTKSMGMAKMAKAYPQRVVNNGIAEQDMVALAAGVATCGYQVYAASYAPFISMRALEQIRTFVAYPNLDVKFISGLSGLTGDVEGATHQGIEDIAIMRAIPNMTVLSPADARATEVIAREMAKVPGPAYLRLGRKPSYTVFDEMYRFTWGKANVLSADGTDLALVATGTMVVRCLEALKILRSRGIRASLLEVPSIKPLDVETLVQFADRCGKVMTVEEHNIYGGLGGAVAEALSGLRPTPMRILGIRDVFTESGTYDSLVEKYGLDEKSIAGAAEAFVAGH